MNGLPIKFETTRKASVSSGKEQRQPVEHDDSAGYGKLHSGYEKFSVMKIFATEIAIGP